MKATLLFISTLLLFTSCKKDYACYGSEEVFYKWSSKSASGLDIITETQQKFVVYESCINCSKKDVNNIGKIMAQFLVDMEERYEEPLLEEHDKMYSKSIEDYVITCQEK